MSFNHMLHFLYLPFNERFKNHKIRRLVGKSSIFKCTRPILHNFDSQQGKPDMVKEIALLRIEWLYNQQWKFNLQWVENMIDENKAWNM